MIMKKDVNVHVVINYGNSSNKIISLVRGRYRVLHAKVNPMGVGGRVVDGDRTVSGAGQLRRDGIGEAGVGREQRSGGAYIGGEGQRNIDVGRECVEL